MRDYCCSCEKCQSELFGGDYVYETTDLKILCEECFIDYIEKNKNKFGLENVDNEIILQFPEKIWALRTTVEDYVDMLYEDYLDFESTLSREEKLL